MVVLVRVRHTEAQHDVTDRPAPEVRRRLRDRLADADSRAEMLVGGFDRRMYRTPMGMP